MFSYHHRIQFYETDLMGIVHHSNYLRIFEEARVAWAHHRGLIDFQSPQSAAHFAVLETHVRHLKPARFGDEVVVQVQGRLEGARIVFEYKMTNSLESQNFLAIARTVHVPLDEKLKLIRPPTEIKEILEKEKWIETWLSNL